MNNVPPSTSQLRTHEQKASRNFGCDSPVVSTSSDHAHVAQLKLDKLLGLASLNVQHDGVIHLIHVTTSVLCPDTIIHETDSMRSSRCILASVACADATYMPH